MKVKNLILGAGIAGLAAANELNKSETAVFEAADHSGGLCSSFEINGFNFDSAVHLSFTSRPEARTFFDKTPYLKHSPNPYNFRNGQWIKHPALNNLFLLPVEEKVQCIKDFALRDKDTEIKTYEDWLRASYGSKLCEIFYDVYTEKYWTVKPVELSTAWVGARLNEPDWDKLLTGAFQIETGTDYYAQEMRYPVEGKYESFLKPLLENANIRLNKKAVEININKKMCFFADDTGCKFENIISTIPLPELVKLLGKSVPKEVCAAAESLAATSVSIVSVGFDKPDIQPYLWFYIYDRDILAARVNAPSVKSPQNVPNGCSSLQFEIYHNPKKDMPQKEEILENVKYSIRKMRLCDNSDILFMDYKFLPYGNVIFYAGMEEKRKIIRDFLALNNIETAGRFGEWDYLWSDQSYLSGKRAGERVSMRKKHE